MRTKSRLLMNRSSKVSPINTGRKSLENVLISLVISLIARLNVCFKDKPSMNAATVADEYDDDDDY